MNVAGALLHRLRQRVLSIRARDAARSHPEPRVLAPHDESALPHVEPLPRRDVVRVGEAPDPGAQALGPQERDRHDERETDDHDDASAAEREQHDGEAGREADPRAPHVGGAEPAQRDEPHDPAPARTPRGQQRRQAGQEQHREDPAERHVDAEGPASPLAPRVEPAERPQRRGRRGARRHLDDAHGAEHRPEDREQAEESLDPVGAPERVGGDEERERGERALGGEKASPRNVRREGRHEGRQAEDRDEDSQRPGLISPHGRIAQTPEPQRGEDGQRALGEGHGRREADDEDRKHGPAQRRGVQPEHGAEQPGCPQVGKHPG